VPSFAPLKGRLHALGQARSIEAGEHMHCRFLLTGLALALAPGLHRCPECTVGQGLHEPEPPAHGRVADQFNHDPLGLGMGIDRLRSHLLLLSRIVYEHCSSSSRGAESKSGMPRLLPMLDQGMRGRIDWAQSKISRSHLFTTIENNEGLGCTTLRRARQFPLALSMCDKIARNGYGV